jgi:DNA mismatch repair protein MSH5
MFGLIQISVKTSTNMINADKEIEIIHELGVRVLNHEDGLGRASDTCGELDCLVALANGAIRYNLHPPHMTTDNIISIKQGRHILQELVVPSFIANDTHLVGGVGCDEHGGEHPPDNAKESFCPSMMVMTGPNHSGKSIYLKQVALIVYLAHIGSYVPAELSVIGLTDKILTRVATQESVSRNESAFGIDLRQAAFSINSATRRSLVLVDEFGKGTNVKDGAALLSALLDHFISLGSERPRMLAATHFHEIFENGFIVESPDLAFAHLEVHLDPSADNDEDKLTFLYQLVEGRSVTSYGTQCAVMNGVDKAIVERADAITVLLARGEDLTTACAKLSSEELSRLEEAEGVAREFLLVDLPETPAHQRRRAQWSDPCDVAANTLARILQGDSHS